MSILVYLRGYCLYLVNAVVQRHSSHVFNVLAVFNAPQFYQQVVPLPVVDPNLGEAQRRHQLLSQQHLHTHLLLTHLEGRKDLLLLYVDDGDIFIDNHLSEKALYHEVYGGGGSGVGLHQGASGLSGAEHEANVPGDSDGDLRLAPGDQSLAIEELRGWHRCGGEGQE